MPISINGQSITITGATIEVVNGVSEESGVAYLIITPDGGVGSLPFMATGLPGSPTEFTVSYVQLAAGVTLPVPNPVRTLVDAGGPGLPAKYDLIFYGNAGATGSAGTSNISTATDLATSPVLGVSTEKFTLVYRNSDGKWVPTAQKVGDVYSPSAIASTAFNNTPNRQLASLSFPALQFDWRPIVFAQTVITGSVDTRVDLVARLNDPATGDEVGYGKGLIGTNVAGIQTIMIPSNPGGGSSLPSSYGKVTAGNAATVYLRAEQKASSSGSWSTPALPNTTFQVVVHALP